MENRLREARELEEVIASHERRLKEEERKLNGVDRGSCYVLRFDPFPPSLFVRPGLFWTRGVINH